MPYLGLSLYEMASQLDLLDLGHIELENAWFRGFTRSTVDHLVSNLVKAHLAFAEKYCYIHGDIFQHSSPNNIVYHPDMQKLFLVDAEALAPLTNEAFDKQASFIEQMEAVDSWMRENLVV